MDILFKLYVLALSTIGAWTIVRALFHLWYCYEMKCRRRWRYERYVKAYRKRERGEEYV